MAAVRHNRPTIIVFGGTIQAGVRTLDCEPMGYKAGDPVNIGDTFEAWGAFSTGRISEAQCADVVRHACPGAGACGGMYTANTMSSILEVMGISLPYSASTPAVYDRKLYILFAFHLFSSPAIAEKVQECLRAGEYMKDLLAKDIKPRDIITRSALLNAITITNILGGSTNAVLHLLAIARSAEVPLTIADFQSIRDRTPYLADLRPSGAYMMEDLHKAGGIPAILAYLLQHPIGKTLLEWDGMTVTGKTMRENLEGVNPLVFEGPGAQSVIRPIERALKDTGHLTILRGSLAPGSAVAKLTGKEGLAFEVSMLD